MEVVELTSQGQKIVANIFHSNTGQKSPGVIFFHGLTSNQTRYSQPAELLAANGINAMTLDCRGHGQSEGSLDSLTIKNNISDAVAAYEFFSKLPNVDTNNIGLCGGSYSAVLAAALTEKFSIKSLVLRAPAAYSNKMMSMKLSEIMDDEENVFKDMNQLSNTGLIQTLKKFGGSVLAVASENDNIIPLIIPQTIIEQSTAAKNKELIIIRNAPHSLQDPKHKQEFSQIVLNWFNKTLN